MQALSNRHRSFAIDLWGFGDSSKTVGDYSIESHVDMLAEFINKMGIARPMMLVGHSLGAIIALRYAREAPKSVDRIATVALPLSREHVNGQLNGKTASAVLDQTRNKFNAFPEVTMGLDKTSAEALEQSTGQISRVDPVDDLIHVECPVLLVFGARDTLVRQPSNELDEPKREGLVRHCVSLENCSHYPMLEQPAVFNRLLREFVDHASSGNLEPKDYWQRRTR
jgi:pimeloyl-ACP methyl ester carboxylesterase